MIKKIGWNTLTLKKAYGIMCDKVNLQEHEGHTPPFSLSYCEIEPNGTTIPHQHYDGELFLILEGTGVITIDQQEEEISSGEAVFLQNHLSHQLKNRSHDSTLKFVSLYWDQSPYTHEEKGDFLILSAPPTPNGKLHLGHLSGPYFSADVLKRYLLLKKLSVHYATGADENQTYVYKLGLQTKTPPLDIVKSYSDSIQQILQDFKASPDSFLLPHQNQEYQHFIQKCFLKLIDKGVLEKKEGLYPYCDQCQSFLHEAHISGLCPHCHKPTNGNGCEACGHYNDCRDLIDPQCNSCHASLSFRPSTRFVFPLSNYRQKLEKALNGAALSGPFYQYAQKLLKNKKALSDITITYPYPWGISVPNSSGEVIYEWFEMAFAYLYHAKKASPTHDYRYFWANPKNHVVLSFGFDNSFFYLALVPALLWAYDEEINYPYAFLTNFFYLLEGQKFSTSRRHAIWGDDFFKEFHPDHLRLYLSSTRAELFETNFSIDDFKNFTQRWADDLGKLLQKIGSATKGCEVFTTRERRYLYRATHLIKMGEFYLSPPSFSLNNHYKIIEDYVDLLKESLYYPCHLPSTLALLQGLAQLIYPLCPTYGQKIFDALDMAPTWATNLDLFSNVTTLSGEKICQIQYWPL